MEIFSKVSWWIYDLMMKFMEKFGGPRPISREEMDKYQKHYEEMAKENPDKVVKE